MSRKQPVRIEVKETLTVKPSDIFESEVKKSGNGAVINAFKKDIGKKVIVIVKEDDK
jgi:putative transposon-encoded protein